MSELVGYGADQDDRTWQIYTIESGSVSKTNTGIPLAERVSLWIASDGALTMESEGSRFTMQVKMKWSGE